MGIPQEYIDQTASLPYNDIEAARSFLRAHAGEVAAVILEPVVGNMGVVPATKEFMTMLRAETSAIGALLIYDEVITGFRVSLTGALPLYGVTPDLICYAKIVGGGFPAAAFGGRKEIMDFLAPVGPVYRAGTLSGNPVAMQAGLETLRISQNPYFYENLEMMTNMLTHPIKQLIEERNLPACLQQVGSMFTLFLGVRKVSSQSDLKVAILKHLERCLFSSSSAAFTSPNLLSKHGSPPLSTQNLTSKKLET